MNFKKPSNIFLLLGLLFGVIFTFFIPLGNTNDEANHFVRIQEIASFQFKYTTYKQALEKNPDLKIAWVAWSSCNGKLSDDQKLECKGSVLDASVAESYYMFEGGMLFHWNKPYDWGKFRSDASWLKNNTGKKMFFPARQTSTYSPFAYIPQVLAVWITKPFNIQTAITIYLCRLFILLTSLFLGVKALRILEEKFTRRCWYILPIFLLPMLIQQSMSLGADALSIWPVVLAMALIIQLINRPKQVIDKVSILIPSALITLGVLAKPPMLIFILLFTLFIKHHKKLSIIAMLIPTMAFVIWTKVSEFLTVKTYEPYGDTAKHWQDLMHTNIFLFIGTFFEYFKGMFTTTKYWGGAAIYEIFKMPGYFGQQDIWIPFYILIPTWIGIFAILILVNINFKKEKKNNQKKLKLIPAILTFLIVPVFFFGNLLIVMIISTASDTGYIKGFQARYMLIILLLLFLTDFKFRKLTESQEVINDAVLVEKICLVSFAVFLLIVSTVIIYIRYAYGVDIAHWG